MKKSFLIALVLVLIPGVSFCQTIKIGLLHVFSGPMATFGQVAEQGARLAVEEINASGGLLGRKLEVVTADDQAKPEAGLKGVEKLVTQDGVDIVVGMVSSAVALKVAPEMDRLQTPLIITGAMADDLTGPKHSPWVFRMTWSTRQALKGSALVAKSELKADTWSTLGPDYGFGQECWDYFKRFLEDLGSYKFVSPEFSPVATKDWKPYIDKLNASGAKGVLISLWGNNLRDFIKQANAEKFFDGKEVICVVGAGVEVFFPLGFLDMPVGVWFGGPYWHDAVDTPLNAQFIDAYTRLNLTGIPPSYAVYTTYAAVKMYAEAVRSLGTTNKKEVAKALEGLTLELPGGSTSMGRADHQAIFPLVFGRTSDKPSKYGKRIRGLDPVKTFSSNELGLGLD
jgi:branched-chain amino acid transport system substrate-binding protein